ncbi:MAG: helix-turn-helix domain-containing protein [Streptosporangiaceae bacterium]
MSKDETGGGPTVRRILLGVQLRRLREEKGISREDAGYTIRASESKISRMELGRVSFKERDIRDLLVLYGVADPDEREVFVGLAREANEPGWWHRYHDLLPGWFLSYVGLEEAADRIRTYEVQFVPGLLQTEDYARAVTVEGLTDVDREVIERWVALRMGRQRLLKRPNPPQLWAVLDEAALSRQIGGPEVMRGQLEHLIEVSKLNHITLQVIPFEVGGHAAEGGAFVVLRFGEPDLPDVAYTEQLTSALYLDKPEDVDRYVEVMDRLTLEAASPDDTVEFLTKKLRRI